MHIVLTEIAPKLNYSKRCNYSRIAEYAQQYAHVKFVKRLFAERNQNEHKKQIFNKFQVIKGTVCNKIFFP